jgi:hypothetical protein
MSLPTINVVDETDLDRFFDYHPSNTDFTSETHSKLRHAMKLAALRILQLVPDSEEKTEAMKRLREAMYWANSGIANHQLAARTNRNHA